MSKYSNGKSIDEILIAINKVIDSTNSKSIESDAKSNLHHISFEKDDLDSYDKFDTKEEPIKSTHSDSLNFFVKSTINNWFFENQKVIEKCIKDILLEENLNLQEAISDIINKQVKLELDKKRKKIQMILDNNEI